MTALGWFVAIITYVILSLSGGKELKEFEKNIRHAATAAGVPTPLIEIDPLASSLDAPIGFIDVDKKGKKVWGVSVSPWWFSGLRPVKNRVVAEGMVCEYRLGYLEKSSVLPPKMAALQGLRCIYDAVGHDMFVDYFLEERSKDPRFSGMSREEVGRFVRVLLGKP